MIIAPTGVQQSQYFERNYEENHGYGNQYVIKTVKYKVNG
jgi:hypothetical protein